MRILALSSWWPEPADNGARLRINHLLRALARTHEVHLLALAQEPVTPMQHARMAELCASVAAVQQRRWTPSNGALLASIWRRDPQSVRATYSDEFAALTQQRAAAIDPDLVIAFQLAAAPYALLAPDVPRIFEEVETTVLWEQFRHERNPRRRVRAYLTWSKHQSYLRRLLAQFDACTVVSAPERRLVEAIAGNTIHLAVVPNGATISERADAHASPEPDTLIYPGALSYDANYDAVAYFAREILPLLRALRPNVRLRVTGKTEPAQRAALGAPGIEWTGYVADIRGLIARSWAEVVPLRRGGGTRLKVLEALAIGTPVVATSKGVEGLAVQPGRHTLIADTPVEFARATASLLCQPQLRADLAVAGRELVRQQYDWRVIGARFEGLAREVAARRRQPI
ncbi:glycosyltransferase family 4 protein [Kallotenue papyrolyticum]|uniref:glycosyltransferase family 4 protein n=1 Tax=Kallotenue papyrolyticum TaxID=1325125 RepID=UPI0004785E10|nr:glycosyltransferase family 4 protein [Kallotenue papyrolyticum]